MAGRAFAIFARPERTMDSAVPSGRIAFCAGDQTRCVWLISGCPVGTNAGLAGCMVADRTVWPDARTGAKGQRPTQGRAGAGLASPAGTACVTGLPKRNQSRSASARVPVPVFLASLIDAGCLPRLQINDFHPISSALCNHRVWLCIQPTHSTNHSTRGSLRR